MNEYQKASEEYDKSKEIACDVKNDVIIAAILHQLGNIYFKKQEFENAMKFYSSSLKIKKEVHAPNELYQISKGITLAQMGKALMETQNKNKLFSSRRQQQQKEILSYIWQAHLLFKGSSIIYDKMAQNDLQSIRDTLGENEYYKIINEIKDQYPDI